ncbi:MAG: hypothetical protein QOE51_2673 [Actinoplanes sp.]|jgi:uncharacterized protein with FMN-binding domain|nr:hypothetical protein [Actinoplanes sp.]
MRRITLWLFSTVAALVLLFSYRTSTESTSAVAVAQAPLAPTTTGADPTPSPSASGSGSASGGSGTKAPTTAPTTQSAIKTYTGSAVQTRWGPVQVSITVNGGKITDVAVPVYPNGNGRDQEINAYALPTLRQETLAAQNAAIDTVSGATVTSDGYLQSLQSALDAASLS